MKIYVAGDVHGNILHMGKHVYRAGDRRINHLVVVGDFGLWTHFKDGVDFLDEINEAARINNVRIYAIGGNHENWDHWNWAVDNLPASKGFAYIRNNILLAPKAHRWTWAGKQFAAAGGAVSIDKVSRQLEEKGYDFMRDKYVTSKRERLGPRSLWWPNEELTDDHVREIESWNLEVDYLFTHDCSDSTPWKKRLKPDPDSVIHRARIDRVLRATKPVMHFHGHMHEKYDWLNSIRVPQSDEYPEGWHDVETYGLEHDGSLNSWGVLDTDRDEFLWQGEYHPQNTPAWEAGLYGDVEGVLDAPETGSLIAKINRVGSDS